MFSWISRLFGNSQDRAARIQLGIQADIEAVSQTVFPFLSRSKQLVDQRDLMTPNKHILMYCFACGAIDVAAKEYGKLDETANLAVLLQLMRAIAKNTDAQDISAMHGRCQTLLSTEEGARARATGEQCFNRWQAGEQESSQVLANYLASLPESPAIPDGL